jgi:hypothetical protein
MWLEIVQDGLPRNPHKGFWCLMEFTFVWYFLVSVLFVLLVVGIIAFFAALFAWNLVGRFYHELWGKFSIEAIQVMSGGVALFAGYAAINAKSDWWLPSIVALVCTGLWKLTQICWDWRGKVLISTLDKQIEDLRDEACAVNKKLEFRARLQALFRHAVTLKVGRVNQEVKKLGPGNASIRHLRRALLPKDHLNDMLFDFTVFLRELLTNADRDKYNFRVGLYAETDGVMTAVAGVSYNNRQYDPFHAYQAHEKHYHLNATESPATVVTCVREKRLIIISDCHKADGDGHFVYFNVEQKKYIRSLVAVWIGEICMRNGTMREAAIVIDTDAPGFFKEEDEEGIKCCIDEFAARISLESALDSLTTERKKAKEKPERASEPQNSEEKTPP